jgi:hypothetical protein
MGKQKVGGKCAEKGVEAVAVAPAGMRTRRCTGQRRREELEELEAAFNMKLFVIAATVKQASNPTSGANHAALRDMRLDLLRQSHQFVHEGNAQPSLSTSRRKVVLHARVLTKNVDVPGAY